MSYKILFDQRKTEIISNFNCCMGYVKKKIKKRKLLTEKDIKHGLKSKLDKYIEKCIRKLKIKLLQFRRHSIKVKRKFNQSINKKLTHSYVLISILLSVKLESCKRFTILFNRFGIRLLTYFAS